MASPSSACIDASSSLRPRAARPPHRQHPYLPQLSSSTTTASLACARPVLCIASCRRRKVWVVPDPAAPASCPAPRAPSSSSPPFRELLLFFFCRCISVRLQATAPGVCDACCCRWTPRPPRHLNFVSLFAAHLPSFSPSTTSS
ncbi:hypothetical protein VPH35_104596 [Triticum aestivum]